MAAKTPDAKTLDLRIGNAGLVVLDFTTTNLDNGDTVATGLKNLEYAWFQPSAAFASTVGLTISGSTITTVQSDDNQTGYLFCITRS
jgi:hypothetical protein